MSFTKGTFYFIVITFLIVSLIILVIIYGKYKDTLETSNYNYTMGISEYKNGDIFKSKNFFELVAKNDKNYNDAAAKIKEIDRKIIERASDLVNDAKLKISKGDLQRALVSINQAISLNSDSKDAIETKEQVEYLIAKNDETEFKLKCKELKSYILEETFNTKFYNIEKLAKYKGQYIKVTGKIDDTLNEYPFGSTIILNISNIMQNELNTTINVQLEGGIPPEYNIYKDDKVTVWGEILDHNNNYSKNYAISLKYIEKEK